MNERENETLPVSYSTDSQLMLMLLLTSSDRLCVLFVKWGHLWRWNEGGGKGGGTGKNRLIRR